MFKSMKEKAVNAVRSLRVACLVALSVVMGATAALADDAPAVDFTAVGTKIMTQITAVLPIVLPIAGTLLAIYIGWKLFKRFCK